MLFGTGLTNFSMYPLLWVPEMILLRDKRNKICRSSCAVVFPLLLTEVVPQPVKLRGMSYSSHLRIK